jgi:hypothetical protein
MSRRWSTSLLCCALLVFAASALAAEPPEKLAWNDLVNHPERWPGSCKLTKKISFGMGVAINAGTECKVLAVVGNRAQLLAPDNSAFEAPPDFCDLLDTANATWAKLTPEQRKVDLPAIQKDPTLWPSTVTVNAEQNFGRFVIKAGQTVPMLMILPNQELALFAKGQAQYAPVPAAMTDLFVRSRELAAIEPAKRPGRLNGLLQGQLVDADAKPIDVKPADYYVVYWSGSQCQWCAQYNAKFVEYYNKNLLERKDVQVFGIGNDRQMPVYYAYAKKNHFAWPTLPNENIGVVQAFGNLGAIQMPGIIVMDKTGKIVTSTLKQRGNPLQTADAVVTELDKLIAAKAN